METCREQSSQIIISKYYEVNKHLLCLLFLLRWSITLKTKKKLSSFRFFVQKMTGHSLKLGKLMIDQVEIRSVMSDERALLRPLLTVWFTIMPSYGVQLPTHTHFLNPTLLSQHYRDPWTYSLRLKNIIPLSGLWVWLSSFFFALK